MTTDNFSILYFVTVLSRGTIIKFRCHRRFIAESSSPESPVCTTAVHCHKMTREMVVYKSVWTQRHKKDQRSEISTTGLRFRISEGPRAFAGSALSECHFYPAKSGILQSPSCVCLFVSRISHKLLVGFWWNLVSREVMIIGRPSSKLGVIRIEIRIWDPDNCFSWTTGRILMKFGE